MLFLISKIRKGLVILDVYLIDELKNVKFRFPVNPLNKLSIQKDRKYTTVDIIDFGEVDLLEKGEKITEISFETLFPAKYDSSYCRYVKIPKPEESIQLLDFWRVVENPIRLIITDFKFNDLVSISKFTPEERAGEPGDKYISITFRKFREAKINVYQSTATISTAQLLSNRSDNGGSDYKDGDKVKVTASALNVREGAGTDYNIIGSLSNGATAKVYSYWNGWIQIYFGNSGGWISADYITKA